MIGSKMLKRLSRLGLLCLVAIALNAADYKAGLARLIITPEQPMYMSGYANRTHASEGKIHELWAKALAIEDRKGGRVVIVSTEVVGLPRAITRFSVGTKWKMTPGKIQIFCGLLKIAGRRFP